MKLTKLLPYLLVTLSILTWAVFVVSTHPKHAIVSWDEGFHGGTAYYLSKGIKNNFNFIDYYDIRRDFLNGTIWYLPLWSYSTALLGVLFGPSVDVLRLGSTVFGVLSLILVWFFVKSVSNKTAASIATATLAFVPTFIVYSHLMMVEVPQLFSVSLALLFFLRFLTKPNLTTIDLVFTILAFAIGVATKITAILLIFTTILSFGAILLVFFRNSQEFKRFYSKHTVFFLVAGLLVFNSYRSFTRTNLGVDMFNFYLSQAKSIGEHQQLFLLEAFSTLRHKITFYFKDFSHMPILTVIWVGSGLGYVLKKRSILAIFLFIWVIITYLIFSSVRPQAYQYLLPIFTPISILTGLFWGKIIRGNNILKTTVTGAIIVTIIVLGNYYLPRGEANLWRATVTNQDMAISYITQNAKFGDIVMTSGDGNRLLIKMFDQGKDLQVINYAAFPSSNVPEWIDWVFSDFGPQNPIRLKGLNSGSWEKVATYSSMIEPYYVYRSRK